MAFSASSGVEKVTNAKPGGFRAIQTFVTVPNCSKACLKSSFSSLAVLPMCTLDIISASFHDFVPSILDY